MPPTIIGVGGTSYVYKITPQIAVKILRSEQDINEWKRELRVCDIMAAHPRNPFIMDSYIRLPDAHFVEMIPPPRGPDDWMANRNLQTRLQEHQRRAGREELWRVLEVTQHEEPADVNRWIAQVCAAAAWLESIGLAHGDIQPCNVVLDANGDARLVDLSRADRVGCAFMGSPPYAREVHDERGDHGFGFMGPRTETFALGSFIYALVYGHAPYETVNWSGGTYREKNDLLKDMKFPTLPGSAWDGVIGDCWYGRFGSVTALRDEVLRRTGAVLSSPEGPDREEAIKECQRLLEGGVLDLIERPKVSRT